MFGPLPYLHRLLLVIGALTVSTGIGAWLGLLPAVPIGTALGTTVGLAAGAGVAYLLTHDFHRGSQPARARRYLH